MKKWIAIAETKKKSEQEGRYIEWYRLYIVLIMQIISIALIKKNILVDKTVLREWEKWDWKR